MLNGAHTHRHIWTRIQRNRRVCAADRAGRPTCGYKHRGDGRSLAPPPHKFTPGESSGVGFGLSMACSMRNRGHNSWLLLPNCRCTHRATALAHTPRRRKHDGLQMHGQGARLQAAWPGLRPTPGCVARARGSRLCDVAHDCGASSSVEPSRSSPPHEIRYSPSGE